MVQTLGSDARWRRGEYHSVLRIRDVSATQAHRYTISTGELYELPGIMFCE